MATDLVVAGLVVASGEAAAVAAPRPPDRSGGQPSAVITSSPNAARVRGGAKSQNQT